MTDIEKKDQMIIDLINELKDCGMENTAEYYEQEAVKLGIRKELI